MKKMFILLALLFCCGCSNQTAMLDEIKLGMSISQVEEIYGKPLKIIARQANQDYDLVQCRLSVKVETFENLMKRRLFPIDPYLLTFNLYHEPLTAEECQLLIKIKEITEPNEVSQVMALEGTRPSRLIDIRIDADELARRQMRIQQQQQNFNNLQRQQMQWMQRQQMQHQQEFQRNQQEFQRMQ